MDPTKGLVSEELLLLAKDILHREIQSVMYSSEDDDLDKEYKQGARDAFHKSVEMIYERIEKLKNEQK